MIGQALQAGTPRDAVDALLALVRIDGSQTHSHLVSEALSHGPEAARNVADVVHLLCLLHGRHPGVVDHAAVRSTDGDIRPFLATAAHAFDVERALLTKLVVAVGPLPSTPGQAETETVVLAQNHALDMLAQSERVGCATGAALAVIVDWVTIRRVLDVASHRLSIEAPPCILPSKDQITMALRSAEVRPAIERAMLFGAQQTLAQHRGLWDLLEARAVARSNY